MEYSLIKKVISSFTLLILLATSTQLISQSEVRIKKNTNGESQISIHNVFGNIYLGNMSGDANAPFGILGKDNVFIGDLSGKSNTQGSFNTFLGASAGSAITTGKQNTFLGSYSGQYNTGSNNTFLGNQSGLFNLAGAGNIFLGYKAGQDETGSNKLYIENSSANSTGALIYGEFDNNYLRLNANVNINGSYTLPTSLGLTGQVLGINGNNQFGWTSFSSLFDDDADTWIHVEATPDEDKILFYADGTELMELSKNAYDQLIMNTNNVSIGENTGLNSINDENIFIGNSAGQNHEGGGGSTFIGFNAGNASVATSFNTLLGSNAGEILIGDANTFLGSQSGVQANGNNNTYIGIESGFDIIGNNNLAIGNGAGSNATGNANIFLGSNAGRGSLGGNKLYIENSNANSSAALIYGEFDNDILRFNAEVNINGQYTLPTIGGLESQVLKLNGSNQAQWSSLAILSDSDTDTRIQVEESVDEDIIRFDIEGSETLVMKKSATGMLMMETENISIGREAGMNSNSNDNVFVGRLTGVNQTGYKNTFIGDGAGQNGNAGNKNTFVGSDAGKIITGEENTFLGVSSGEQATGDFNTFVGHASGQSMDGQHNAIFGDEAGAEASGDYNVFLGTEAGKMTDGDANIFIGTSAGINLDGNGNTAIGNGAGTNASGGYNIFLGTDAGSGSAGGDKLYIENSSANFTEALIYGDFGNDLLRINGSLGIGNTPTAATDFHIKQSPINGNGGIRLEYQTDSDYWDTYIDSAKDYNFGYNGSLKSYIKDTDGMYTVSSDRRLKEDIQTMKSTLNKIRKLRATQYRFKNDVTHSKSTGFIAQEVQEVFPEFVSEKDGILRISYDYFIPVAIAGIQELSKENEMLKSELQDMKAEIQEIKALLKK